MYRFIPVSSILEPNDYKVGWLLDTTHYFKVIKKRKELGLETFHDYTQCWDNREGYYIDGTEIETKEHILHSFKLLDRDENKLYRIDSINIHFMNGSYLMLCVADFNTNSHKSIFFENISCHDPLIVDSINENKKRYSLVK
jgi:hypothetical protein